MAGNRERGADGNDLNQDRRGKRRMAEKRHAARDRHFARFAPLARECGITNPPEPVDGHLSPSMAPGWGAEIDWEYVRTRTVSQY